MLVVLLEQDAGEFSVPSKTLSYLAAGRPVLGLMPPENLAAQLVLDAGGFVRAADCGPRSIRRPPGPSRLLDDPARMAQLGVESRVLAEKEFALAGAADAFERDPDGR